MNDDDAFIESLNNAIAQIHNIAQQIVETYITALTVYFDNLKEEYPELYAQMIETFSKNKE